MDRDDKLAASLSDLEHRWKEMARTIREQREQIASLNGKVSEQNGLISDLETQVLQLQDRHESLEQEKAGVIARIEGLLVRYEESDS
ncbi:MAG: hypothetical protein HQL98_03245 [Magnetococcales bacterium]|nr:hypothetical protein [Magnetococcales bacterium]